MTDKKVNNNIRLRRQVYYNMNSMYAKMMLFGAFVIVGMIITIMRKRGK